MLNKLMKEKEFYKEFKNSLLQQYVCKRCNRVFNEYGEVVNDKYVADKTRKSKNTIHAICSDCKNMEVINE
jgi:hypothetical protein